MSDSAYLKGPSFAAEGLKDYSDTVITGGSTSSIPGECLTVNNPEHHLHAVEFAKDYIQKNFTNKLGVEEIAKKVFVSQYHFSRIFKKLTHFSPYQYLLQVRLQHARELMNRTDLPIKEISFQSGFSSIEYFSAAFSRKYKICPTLYRKRVF